MQLAYEDAVAYCSWDGGRLPTEAEFEFAARGGLDRKRMYGATDFKPNGKFMANTFQGHFPDRNTAEDGYASTAPVASFPANGYGLYDMAGNVWEWTSDWYRPDYYQTLAATETVVKIPQGPVDSFDPGNREFPNGYNVEAHSSAPISTAAGTWLAREARVPSIAAPTTWDFVASATEPVNFKLAGPLHSELVSPRA